ncbi:MAG: HlyD family type I secretion periplasmic adaptor subunit [Candidatus Devosia phytovorans]|uniref:Membrane fusion protein (MFP) family protein n=1 Tax=Candidatus Devosia phytovorans TaxID=3121372 RepID=A0AAJ6AYJ9_9HYPH|nr:HlyD family type I secretion periplasmic adaptor subunit [Devosia sp.]WEK03665.1 MAG: HlyD family type I secretion periplasmic adaptor subunit [Devosia sp.]
MMSPSETLSSKFLNPRVPARLGFITIVVFIMVMLGWGALAPLSGAVVANGVLQAEGGRKAVQHPYGGVVAELMVQEGDSVRAGAVLMRLSDAEPRAQYDVLSAERDTLLAAQGRLQAELAGTDAPVFSEDLVSRSQDATVQQAMNNEIALMGARAGQFETRENVLLQQKAQLDERVTSAEAQIAGLDQQKVSITGELEDARALLAQQLIERSRVLDQERAINEIDAQISVLRTDIATANKAMAEADFEIAGLDRERQSAASEDLRANQAALAALTPQLAAAQDALARTDVTATASGTVVGLSVITEGGVVSPGQELLSIIPDAGPMVVEAQMRLADVTDVTRGERADIRLLAVPASTRPALSGTIETVSADRVVDERSGQSFYALRIALDPRQLADANIDLTAGMPVQVVIPTRGRTLIDYLTSPLLDEVSGAFRER